MAHEAIYAILKERHFLLPFKVKDILFTIGVISLTCFVNRTYLPLTLRAQKISISIHCSQPLGEKEVVDAIAIIYLCQEIILQ